MEKIEVKAASVEKAIEEGLNELGIEKDEAIIEVIQEGGLFSKAIVTIEKKENPQDTVVNFMNGLFERMNLRCYTECEVNGDELTVNVSGSDSGVIIGYRGEVLDAIQYLALILVNQKGHNFIRVTINAENYREKRQETLEALAGRLAYKAYRTGQKIELEPMNPFERRIIHTALQDSKFATTESEGEDMNRHVVIVPKEGGVREGYESREHRGYNNNRGNYNRGQGGYNKNRNYNRDNNGGYREQKDYSQNVEKSEETPATDYNLKKNGPPKFKSFGYNSKKLF